ncbi:hypothetical protein A3A66_04025 [Microgenomates group bacterium RIFCSPLOWO2_01_FULL_46_13]|nr:MAG: hypothetical protein A3A66_04025 [Microgenomates group bacterium RIFCSPLOWO2_01_FULL_46_13]
MKKYLLMVISLLLVGAGVVYVNFRKANLSPRLSDLSAPAIPQTSDKAALEEMPVTTVIAENLDTPWAIAFLADGQMLVTERKGTVQLVNIKAGNISEVGKIEAVREIGEGGLLGIALHPDFEVNHYVYLYYTYSEAGGRTLNRVVRMTYLGQRLTDEKVIVDEIPGASNHNGGRIKFGPDKFLYITTGDAQEPSRAQDTGSLAGKILRVTDDGSPAPGNPFDNRVYSYGHRNPQGITWDEEGRLWETEHGPSGAETGNDEFNRIEMGKNYGWPEIRGKQTRAGMVTSVSESGRSDTWAPAGLAYLNGKFYFAGLRGQALYGVSVSGNSAGLTTYFKGELGRIREVVAGPDGMLYVTTSNRDGRGKPVAEDDRIIRVNPDKLP